MDVLMRDSWCEPLGWYKLMYITLNGVLCDVIFGWMSGG
jgi:hypothetical protein